MNNTLPNDSSIIFSARNGAEQNINLTESVQFFRNKSICSILWNYHTEPDTRALSCVRLTDIAANRRWSPHADIRWPTIAVNDAFPCKKEADLFAGFDAYDRLPATERLKISWQRHRMEISEILHGEQLALICASQLISLMPCMESRLFAATQVADEARHVEFFRKYLASMGVDAYVPSPALRHLTLDVLQNPDWEIKLLICQILIESLALAQFNYLLKTHSSVSLQQGLRRVMDDEARHVKFGTDYLKSLFKSHNNEQLRYFGNHLVDKAFELASSDNHCVDIAQQQQWNIHKLRHHLRRQRIRRPELIQQRFRQLSLNINAIGLMSSTIEQRLKRYGCT